MVPCAAAPIIAESCQRIRVVTCDSLVVSRAGVGIPCCWNIEAIAGRGNSRAGAAPPRDREARRQPPRAPTPRVDDAHPVSPGRPRQEAWITFLRLWDWEWTCTLTFRGPVPAEAARKRFRLLESMLNCALHGRRWARKAKQGQGVGWVRIAEYQQRDVIHFHALFTGVAGLRPRDWAAIWRKLAGHATISRIRNMTGSLRYLTKSVPRGGEPEMGGVLPPPPRPMNP